MVPYLQKAHMFPSSSSRAMHVWHHCSSAGAGDAASTKAPPIIANATSRATKQYLIHTSKFHAVKLSLSNVEARTANPIKFPTEKSRILCPVGLKAASPFEGPAPPFVAVSDAVASACVNTVSLSQRCASQLPDHHARNDLVRRGDAARHEPKAIVHSFH